RKTDRRLKSASCSRPLGGYSSRKRPDFCAAAHCRLRLAETRSFQYQLNVRRLMASRAIRFGRPLPDVERTEPASRGPRPSPGELPDQSPDRYGETGGSDSGAEGGDVPDLGGARDRRRIRTAALTTATRATTASTP